MKDEYKISLTEEEMPKAWYNIAPDMPVELAPPLSGQTHQPAGPDDLSPIFPMDLILQEVSTERYIEIPQEVIDVYKLWRPTTLFRARRLEKSLGTPARIYYKYEGSSPAGSHKPNTAVPQAFYNKKAGIKRISTETGAGQWGTAMAMACNMFGLECTVYMVKVSFGQKPYRRSIMELFDAEVYASPSEHTETGRAILAKDPDNQGSLGTAISEAVEDAAKNDDTNYSLGSVLNHVCMHQTVIGEECLLQFQKVGDYPDVVIGCAGGGSNFAGVGFPFLREKMSKDLGTRIIAVEPSACPTLTKGEYTYDFGDVAHFTPLLKMYTLGNEFMPPGIHAGGLRYHGMGPLVSAAYNAGLIEAVAVPQLACFDAAIQFAKAEAIVPAPESSHAIRVAIDEALRCKDTGEEKSILFNLSGNGYLDLSAYDLYHEHHLEDYEYPRENVEAALAHLPQV